MGVFDGRDAADLERWARQQPKGQMLAVEVVCLDPHEGYRKAIRSLKARSEMNSRFSGLASTVRLLVIQLPP